MSRGHVEVDFENGKALAAVHGLHRYHQGFHMLRETGNVGWTSECCHRITESFRSDRSYSLCQVCSPLCPGNAQASVNSSLAAPEVCRRISHCAKERDNIRLMHESAITPPWSVAASLSFQYWYPEYNCWFFFISTKFNGLICNMEYVM